MPCPDDIAALVRIPRLPSPLCAVKQMTELLDRDPDRVAGHSNPHSETATLESGKGD
jgi:hypothetical protein